MKTREEYIALITSHAEELQNTFGVFGQMRGQTFEIGIKSHAEHGVNGVDSLVEFFDEHDVAFSFTKRKAENAFRKNRFS